MQYISRASPPPPPRPSNSLHHARTEYVCSVAALRVSSSQSDIAVLFCRLQSRLPACTRRRAAPELLRATKNAPHACAADNASCCGPGLRYTYEYDCPDGGVRGPVNDEPTAQCPGDLICCIAREPTPPDDPLPTAGWTATSDSAETRKENGRAANVLDGDTATIWHSRWSRNAAPLPHYIELEFGGDSYSVTGLRCGPLAARA